jgi:hypothetical protein
MQLSAACAANGGRNVCERAVAGHQTVDTELGPVEDVLVVIGDSKRHDSDRRTKREKRRTRVRNTARKKQDVEQDDIRLDHRRLGGNVVDAPHDADDLEPRDLGELAGEAVRVEAHGACEEDTK